MSKVTMKDLLESGVHFGHQTRRWDPKMAQFIFTERNGIHIIDLQKTLTKLNEATDAMAEVIKDGGNVLFVGTKKQAQASVREAAEACGMYYVTTRWLGGTLTNFETIKKSINRLHRLERMEADGSSYQITKKERLVLSREKEKLEKNVGGLKNMNRLPDAVFIVDPKREAIAVAEARKLRIPIFAIVDTNCDPTVIDHVVPGNDDAIRAIKLFVGAFQDTILEAAGESGRAIEAAGGDYVEGSSSFSAGTDNFGSGEAAAETSSPFEKQVEKNLSGDGRKKYDEKYGEDQAEAAPAPAAAAVPAAPEVKPAAKAEAAPKSEPKPAAKAEAAPAAAGSVSAADVKALRDKTAAGMMECKKALAQANGDMALAERLLKEKGLADAAKRVHRATKEGVVAIADGKDSVAVTEVYCETDFVARNDVFQKFANEVAAYVLGESKALTSIDDFSPAFVNDKIKGTIATLGENITIGRMKKLSRGANDAFASYIHGGGKIGVAVRFTLGDVAAADKDAFKVYARDIAMQIASMNPVALDRSSVPEAMVEEQKDILRKKAAESGKPADIVEKMLDGQIAKFFKEITLVDQAWVKDNKQTISQLTAAVGKEIGTTITIAEYVRFMVGEELG